MVDITPDSDVWINVIPEPQFKEPLRFRTFFGGGKNEKIRLKLIELLRLMEEVENENENN